MACSFRGWMRLLSPIAAALVMLPLAGCIQPRATGGVQGRVLHADGTPAFGVRVALDQLQRHVVVTDLEGRYHLGGAPSGAHELVALLQSANAGGAEAIDVPAGAIADAPDLELADCTGIVNATPDGTPTGAAIPCTATAPPPPPATLHFDAIQADSASGAIDPSSFSGWGQDTANGIEFDVVVAGDFTAGGGLTLHVTNASTTTPTAFLGVEIAGAGGDWFYLLESGDLSLTVDPTGAFDLHASNLTLAYLGWDGSLDATSALTIGALTAAGTATPATTGGPTTNVDLGSISGQTDAYLCSACEPGGGDELVVSFFDPADGVSLDLDLPVASLALPGSVTISGASDPASGVFGSARLGIVDGGSWTFHFLGAKFASSSPSVATGAPLSLTMTQATFVYEAYDPNTPSPGPEQVPTLSIGSVDLSTTVQSSAPPPAAGGAAL